MKHKGLKSYNLGAEILDSKDIVKNKWVSKSNYAYLMDWDDYNSPAALAYLQSNGVITYSAFKPLTVKTNESVKSFNYGTILIPVSKQKIASDKLYSIVLNAQRKYNVPVYQTSTGFSIKGIDLGSNNFRIIKNLKAALLVGEGVNSYEAGEVWHLLDTRVNIPITKIRMSQFERANLDKYNSLVIVSGYYNQLDSTSIKRIKNWVSKGNTLITIANASKWAISKKLVDETLVKHEDSSDNERKRYVDASEHIGRERLGGAIFKVNLDRTHPLAFGYRDSQIPVYKNNNVFIKPSKNAYSNVAIYTKDPHIDGYISKNNMDNYLKSSASLIISKIGSGRVVMFADNPNFRGSWYGTNKLFLNALFLGSNISVPGE
jgi:hypothetical protein